MRTLTNPSTASHANETPAHLADKITLGGLFAKCDFDYVLFEHGHSDVVGVRRHGGRNSFIAGELERSSRNLLRNLERNFRQGAVGTIVACPNFTAMAAVARKLSRYLTPSQSSRVGLTNLTTLQLLHPDFPKSQSTTGGTDAH